MYTLLHTFFSIMVHHRILNTVLCAMRKKPVVYSFSVKKSGGFPGGSVAKNLPVIAGNRRLGFHPLGKTPWRRKWQPTPVFLPGESRGQRSLVGYTAHGVAKRVRHH